MIVLSIVAGRMVISSSLFEVTNIDIEGASLSLRPDIEKSVRQAIGQAKLLDVDLEGVRTKVELLPRVRKAQVSRLLPNSLRVEIIERQPAVLIRRQTGSLVWLDSDGIELGDVSGIRIAGTNEIPPIGRGFSEGNRPPAAITEDRERIKVYKLIEREFSEGGPSIWNLVDEINLTYTTDVSLHMARPPVTVHVGNTKYRERFEKALKILDAINRGDSELLYRYQIPDVKDLILNPDNIGSIDASRDNRVVLTPITNITERKAPPATPAQVKKR